MQRYKFLGMTADRKTACVLTCLLPFSELNAESIDVHDFHHRATNWNGRDSVERTLSLQALRLTGREIKLKTPLVFYGQDSDMGHVHSWTYPVSIIAETEPA